MASWRRERYLVGSRIPEQRLRDLCFWTQFSEQVRAPQRGQRYFGVDVKLFFYFSRCGFSGVDERWTYQIEHLLESVVLLGVFGVDIAWTGDLSLGDCLGSVRAMMF